MRLDRLHIQNFRCYEDATFDFQPGFNLVVGVNGSGKTSLLNAVAQSFGEIFASAGHSMKISDDDDVRTVINHHQNGTRFEKTFPLTLECEGNAFQNLFWARTKRRLSGDEFAPIPVLNTKNFGPSTLAENTDIPLIAFYRADRRWTTSSASTEQAASLKLSRLDGYKNWSNAATNLQDFESWLVKKTLEQLQKAFRSAKPVTEFYDELSLVNSALQAMLPGSSGLYYDVELASLIVDMGGNATSKFSNLSDGQRGMIALFADIARRMCILNPHMGKDVLKNTSGVVIIDELDIHLHPAWQRSIVPALRLAFPKVQFIAASHSPQIIGSLKPEEVILLHNGDPTHPRVTYGLDSSSVLEEVMGVTQREPEIEDLLSELFSTLEDNDLEKAKSQLEALKKKAPDLPEFAGAEALIRRKEILGK
ncbi:AAA family ATPase [Pseudomonas moraviensis]|uniref:Putative ATP-binding protein involved in virulence n=1 Tax=Pseudomonas moraviensis TaxID=321662 RepID=A0A7Y9VTZ0_9PSED|nr:AAA family ATPase [Pseudomonas moraviensis]NYH08531.1 putative ATP-binding protein involved in virulence [Pseudomonas moraviensis]